eukprot:GILI01011305.1.p1 GENE.GILI01011305.1~~GILI01011305.1.p1  ORF type:complete len:362 (+),score=130.68 GILI01011305.1:118-1203(+)
MENCKYLQRLATIHNHIAPVPQEEVVTPVRVLVTGAAGQISYSLLFLIASGRMLGPNQPVILHLLEVPAAINALEGVVMELKDACFPLIKGIVPTSDLRVAFSNIDIAVLVGARPRGPGMERKDLLGANAAIFREQGRALNEYANKNVKVCVVGNPANTNALIASMNAPTIPKENFTALTRLDQNRAQAQLSAKCGVAVEQVKNVIIWGNHSATQYPDVNHGFIAHYPQPHFSNSIRAAVGDDAWLNGDFIKTVQQRGAAIIKARKLSSAASAASAACDHVRDWWCGTAPGEWVSMAVPSDGSYGIPDGVIYSYPVTCHKGTYKIVQGLNIDAFSRQKMAETDKELREEKEMAVAHLNKTA